MDKELFIRHRRDFLQRMDDHTFALFFSGEAPHRTTDEYYPYFPNRNFFYLTGLERPNFALCLLKNEGIGLEFLFIEEATDYSEKWLGHRLTKEEASALSGFPVSAIQFVQNLEAFVSSAVLSNSRKALMKMPKKLYLDLYRHQSGIRPVALGKARFITESYPEIDLANANEILDLLRMVKAPEETARMKKAVGYAKIGLEAVWKEARPGLNEHALEALFEYKIKVAGSEGLSFDTIMASGVNATTLHYKENKCVIGENDLVLADLGCLDGPYASDITRTFPATGHFTPRQKELYQLVLDVNKQCIDFVKPGITWNELNSLSKKLLAEGAVKLGVIKDVSEVEKVYYHTVSHYLGLDVHDVGTYQVPFREGLVLTIEPGIYVAAEKIGIRIEDNILVTKDGHENLSSGILKEIADIEKFMNR